MIAGLTAQLQPEKEFGHSHKQGDNRPTRASGLEVPGTRAQEAQKGKPSRPHLQGSCEPRHAQGCGNQDRVLVIVGQQKGAERAPTGTMDRDPTDCRGSTPKADQGGATAVTRRLGPEKARAWLTEKVVRFRSTSRATLGNGVTKEMEAGAPRHEAQLCPGCDYRGSQGPPCALASVTAQ